MSGRIDELAVQSKAGRRSLWAYLQATKPFIYAPKSETEWIAFDCFCFLYQEGYLDLVGAAEMVGDVCQDWRIKPDLSEFM